MWHLSVYCSLYIAVTKTSHCPLVSVPQEDGCLTLWGVPGAFWSKFHLLLCGLSFKLWLFQTFYKFSENKFSCSVWYIWKLEKKVETLFWKSHGIFQSFPTLMMVSVWLYKNSMRYRNRGAHLSETATQEGWTFLKSSGESAATGTGIYNTRLSIKHFHPFCLIVSAYKSHNSQLHFIDEETKPQRAVTCQRAGIYK